MDSTVHSDRARFQFAARHLFVSNTFLLQLDRNQQRQLQRQRFTFVPIFATTRTLNIPEPHVVHSPGPHPPHQPSQIHCSVSVFQDQPLYIQYNNSLDSRLQPLARKRRKSIISTFQSLPQFNRNRGHAQSGRILFVVVVVRAFVVIVFIEGDDAPAGDGWSVCQLVSKAGGGEPKG